MFDLGDRSVVVLLSVTCGFVLIYYAWGAILTLAFTLFLVTYACYSLLANDSLLSPDAYRIFGYLTEAFCELGSALRLVRVRVVERARDFARGTSRFYRELRQSHEMPKRRHPSAYQLSSDPYVTVDGDARDRLASASLSFTTSRFGSIDQLSPIPRMTSHSRADNATSSHGKFYEAGDDVDDDERRRGRFVFKHTSTPVTRPGDREDDFRNGDVDSRRLLYPKRMPVQTYALSCGENIQQFSPEGSPWGVSISPAMRPRPAGVKTVQTVAGPLLASTRYNIDPKVYTDVTSPGLTTRLTKYATEAKNKLTHQSQYGTGQFPKVNLYANPIPVLNAKSTKMRIPVTVRIASPDVTKYSPPERQKILSNICHTENRSPTSVVQVLKEISLKRHASTEDVIFDIAKKQKTDSFYNEERELIFEENKQKRGRDESSKSEEDLSSQNKSIRPAKRTKTRSCYDILNSLSSSMHISSGVKRKAVDFSRSGTPDFEKHFKSLESTHSSNSPILQSQNLNTSHTDIPEFNEMYSRNLEGLKSKKMEEFPLMKGILKSSNKESRINLNKAAPVIIHKAARKGTTETTESVDPSKFVELTEKLFMRAEPERNERLKTLIEEPSNIKVKFATDNVEEIKREDIRNMRQTNMKARLQSMFDAISGKAENKINPDVVIQADDINATFTTSIATFNNTPVTCSVTCATLNSSTTTININTTPLSTAAIVPSGFSSSNPNAKLGTKPAITFSSPNAAPDKPDKAQLNVPSISTPATKATTDRAKIISTTPVIANAGFFEKVVPSTSSTTSIFTFDKPKATTSPAATSSTTSSAETLPATTSLATASNSSLMNFGTISSNNNAFTLTTTFTPTPSSTSVNFSLVNKTPSSSAFTLVKPNATTIQTNKIVTTSANVSASTAVNTTQANFTFALGESKPFSFPSTIVAATTTSSLSPRSTGMMLPVKTTSTSIVNTSASFNNIVNNTSNNHATTTTSAASLSFTFGNNSSDSQLPKSSSFMFGQSNSNTQSKENAFRNLSSNQMTSLPQVTTKSFNFTSNIVTTTAAGNSFTNTTNASLLTSSSTATSGLPSSPLFSLNTSATSATSTSSASKPLFVFGSSNASNAATSTTAVLPSTITSGVPSFGGVKNNAVLAFGASTSTVTPQFSASTIAVPQFGVTTASIFAASSSPTTSASIFGSSSSNNNQSFFGTPSTVPGTTNIFSPTTTVPSSFVTTANSATSSNTAIDSTLFANPNANAGLTPTTAAPSMFSSNAPIFGQTKPSPSTFATTSGMFGNSTTSSTLFSTTAQPGTTASTFNIAGTNITTITPGFDGANNTTLAFGTPSIGTSQPTSAFGGTSGMFSSTDKNTSAVPIFGTSAAPAGGNFGGASLTTSTFGAQNPTSLAFGASPSGGTMFGDNKSSFGATPTTTADFATPTSSSIPAFGVNNASNNTNAMFVFGSNQKDGQQNATFSFGSNFNAGSSNSTAASATPFQFGSTAPKSGSTGFNFTTPQPATPTLNFGTSAASTFNPSTPGMFSIGSGSTAPRSRTIRTRKPR